MYSIPIQCAGAGGSGELTFLIKHPRSKPFSDNAEKGFFAA
jgi:hypothetical protein